MDGETGAQGAGTREVVEEGGGRSPGRAPGPHGPLTTMQAAAHSKAPARRKEEPGKAKPQETAARWSGESPYHCLPLPSSAGGGAEASAPSKETVLLW